VIRGGAIAIRGGAGGSHVTLAKSAALRMSAGGVKEGETLPKVEIANSVMPHSGLGGRWSAHGNFNSSKTAEGVGSTEVETPEGGTESESYLILGMSVSAVSTGGLGIATWKLERVKATVKSEVMGGKLGCKAQGERKTVTFTGVPLMPIGEKEKYVIKCTNVSALNFYMNLWGIAIFGVEFKG
jgi:hypothetical protein